MLFLNHGRIHLSALLTVVLLLSGCLPKEPMQTIQPEVAAETAVVPSATLVEDDSAEEAVADLSGNKPTTPEEMRATLDGVQALTQKASDFWRGGDQENALADLDKAFENLLLIETDDLDIIQEKENLRLLISKRIVEVYSSRKVTTGRMDRAIPIVRNEHVEAEIRSFLGPERNFFLAAYARSGMYRPMIVEALRREGIPEQLSWLPLIESGFKNNALSTARALGMWQFIPSTGFRYGLARDKWIDERMDPEKATQAAIAYLRELHEMFGDWMAALAGYNCGESRVMRTIKSQQINYMDDFWDLYGKLPRETARYVPRFLATLILLENPAKYGLELPPLNEPIAYKTVEVNRSVKLADLNSNMGLPTDTLRILNPELRHRATPDSAYQLRVPIANYESLAAQIEALPKMEMIPELSEDSDDGLRHKVRRGETLSGIASKYKTTVSKLIQLNKLKGKTRIAAGQQLRIPGNKAPFPNGKKAKGKSGSAKQASSDSSEVAQSDKDSARVHKVKHGESLWSISQLYKTSTNQLRVMNNLKGSSLVSGQKLMIPGTTSSSDSVDAKNNRTYQVRRGDTLAKIAQKHKVGLVKLLKANNMKSNDPIYPKQTLVVPY